jgi:uncharacterized lipoprotein YddW (UPF0748 family)
MRSAAVRLSVVLCATASILCLPSSPSIAPLQAQDEVRALWVVRTTLTSPAAVASMVDAAQAGGFNTLIVQVRGRGDAYFLGGVEPRPAALAAQPSFDPLAVTIARAHQAGLQVHAWINVNLVAGAADRPAERDHVVYRHPEWLMVPRAIAEDVAGVDARSPEYVGRLLRYLRGRSNDVEGLYLSPIPAAAAAYTTSVVRDIASRYELDGVHFDYIRYPAQDFDFSHDAIAAFRASLSSDLTPDDRRRYDARASSGEPLIYTQVFPERWRQFRTARLTALVDALHTAVRAVRPSAVVSVAVNPSPATAASQFLQDWRGWIDRGLVDVICPMAYTTDTDAFASEIEAVHQAAGRHPVWAGIGAYRLSADQIAANVRSARRIGVHGVAFFSYDSLIDAARGPGFLLQVARAAFNQ